jgi:hypothetical protein
MKVIQQAYDLSQKEEGAAQDIQELISISRLKIAWDSQAPILKITEYFREASELIRKNPNSKYSSILT